MPRPATFTWNEISLDLRWFDLVETDTGRGVVEIKAQADLGDGGTLYETAIGYSDGEAIGKLCEAVDSEWWTA